MYLIQHLLSNIHLTLCIEQSQEAADEDSVSSKELTCLSFSSAASASPLHYIAV